MIMLAALKLDDEVYVEPNDKTLEILAEGYCVNDKEAFIRRTRRDGVFPVKVRGGVIKRMLKLPLKDAFRIFGENMVIMKDNTGFDNDTVYFEQEDTKPIYNEVLMLPTVQTFILQPNSAVIIPTKFDDGDTVSVFVDEATKSVSALWVSEDTPYYSEYSEGQIHIGWRHDYIIRFGRNAIRLKNDTSDNRKVSISFARYGESTKKCNLAPTKELI